MGVDGGGEEVGEVDVVVVLCEVIMCRWGW